MTADEPHRARQLAESFGADVSRRCVPRSAPRTA